MQYKGMFGFLFRGSKPIVTLKALVLIALVACADWLIIGEIPLGFLYLLPMAMVGNCLELGPITAMAALCTLLAEKFSDLGWNLHTGISRDVLYFAAFLGAGVFTREVNRNRQTAALNLREIEAERDARREAEEQLKVLIESTPVAVVTTDAGGKVLMANDAAHRLLGVREGELAGQVIHRYLPALKNVCTEEPGRQLIRAVMQARGQRQDGETFLADICFSTYSTDAGARLAAMVLDASEDLRAHEVAGLQQLLEGSRLAVGALSHEVRNVCGAIAVVHRNLERAATFTGNKDFEALGNLVEALDRIASVNLRESSSQASELDLSVILDELKIIITPAMQEDEIALEWSIESNLPLVWGDRSSLMQVFLNLVNNSARALARQDNRRLTLCAKSESDRVVLSLTDNGGGVAHPEFLFRPFQVGAEATGLGLFLSRAFVRSFKGDLRYEPVHNGACFIVELMQVTSPALDAQ